MPSVADRPRRAQRRSSRPGLTLIELMLALMLTGFLFLGGRLMLDQLADAGAVLARHAGESDTEANAERLLRALVGRADAAADTARPFAGAPDETSFESWCERPAGWLERCRVTLNLQRVGGNTVIAATLSTGERYQLRSFRGRGAFRYLGRGPATNGWLLAWGRSIVAPRAVGVVTEGDTLLLRLGERG
jgi:type II secretory pathway component PulJ